MQTPKMMFLPIAATLVLTVIGCDEDEQKRRAETAEKQLERQAEQNRQMAELHREVAQGTRQLVQADAQARQEMVALQHDVQAERIEVGRQRDSLEEERRELAIQRHRDPILAAAITHLGLLLACLLPLVLCWSLLQRGVEPADEQAVAEVLLEDLVADEPLLLPRMGGLRTIAYRDDQPARGLPDPSDGRGESA